MVNNWPACKCDVCRVLQTYEEIGQPLVVSTKDEEQWPADEVTQPQGFSVASQPSQEQNNPTEDYSGYDDQSWNIYSYPTY